VPFISSITGALVIGGLVAGFILFGWVARISTTPKPPRTLAPIVMSGARAPSSSEKPKIDQPHPSVPIPAAAAAAPAKPPDDRKVPTPAPGPSAISINKDLVADVIKPGPPPPPVQAVANEVEDPEKVVTVFVEQNQKRAETQLKHLKDEAEKLRTRLRKVDAGIKGWESLLEALRQCHGAAAITAPVTTKASVAALSTLKAPADPGATTPVPDSKPLPRSGPGPEKAPPESTLPASKPIEPPRPPM
jgi:hypothetical protein